MLPIELVEIITKKAGIPSLHELSDYGKSIYGPHMYGKFSHSRLAFAREASERTVWRAMRHAANLPITKKQLSNTSIDPRLLHMVKNRHDSHPIAHEAGLFDIIGRVFSFHDNMRRACIYYSGHYPVRMRAWLELYGLWERVECYSNDPKDCFVTGPEWRCRHVVFILRVCKMT